LGGVHVYFHKNPPLGTLFRFIPASTIVIPYTLCLSCGMIRSGILISKSCTFYGLSRLAYEAMSAGKWWLMSGWSYCLFRCQADWSGLLDPGITIQHHGKVGSKSIPLCKFHISLEIAICTTKCAICLSSGSFPSLFERINATDDNLIDGRGNNIYERHTASSLYGSSKACL